MGSRNLICVYYNGEHKVSQYSQWHAALSQHGLDVLRFLEDSDNIRALREKMPIIRYIDHQVRDKEFIESYEANAPKNFYDKDSAKWVQQPDVRTAKQKEWFSTWISRDIGSDILENIVGFEGDEILLREYIGFAKHAPSCEWVYVIDLDTSKFEVYEGFNKSPLDKSARFYFDGFSEAGWYPVKLVGKFSFGHLPTEERLLSLSRREEES